MSNKNITRLAWIACGIVIIGAVVSLIYDLRNRPVDDTIFVLLADIVEFIMFVAFASTGALIISYQPRNWVGWLLIMVATVVFVQPQEAYFNNLSQAPQPSLLTLVSLWIYMWAWLGAVVPILFIPLFFPTGRIPSPRWRWVVRLGLGLCLFFIFTATFAVDFISRGASEWVVSNPMKVLPTSSFFETAFFPLLLLFAVLCVASLFTRYRYAQQVEREQIRWLLAAATLFFLTFAIGSITNSMGGLINDIWGLVGGLVILLLPTAIGVAIIRHRLYDIDLIIRKTVQYGVVTAVLALIYFGTIILLQSLVGQATGEQSPIIIVLSTLLIAALFNPLRKRVQDAVDRRFYRKKYDAAQVLAQFAQTARDEVDMEALQAELLRVVQETLQPESVVVWFKQSEGETL